MSRFFPFSSVFQYNMNRDYEKCCSYTDNIQNELCKIRMELRQTNLLNYCYAMVTRNNAGDYDKQEFTKCIEHHDSKGDTTYEGIGTITKGKASR